MYFLRIILVFFFAWFPGMVMYFVGYTTDKHLSCLLHNLGLIFFSLQAIVSSAMAMSKPDVRKSVYDLFDHKKYSCKRSPKPDEEKNKRTIEVQMDINENAETDVGGKSPMMVDTDVEQPLQ